MTPLRPPTLPHDPRLRCSSCTRPIVIGGPRPGHCAARSGVDGEVALCVRLRDALDLLERMNEELRTITPYCGACWGMGLPHEPWCEASRLLEEHFPSF